MALETTAVAPEKIQGRLMYYFAFVYIAEGIAQTSGIIDQPLKRFLLDGLGWSTFAMSAYLWVLSLPWWGKPAYGLISDCFPIMGYRRKSYLLLANMIASGSLFFLSYTVNPDHMIWELLAVVMTMAISSVLCGALIIECAKHSALASKFCGQQSLWANGATIVSIFAGGWLCDNFSPADALHYAALLGMIGPGLVLIVTAPLVKEQKTKISVERFHEGRKAIWEAARTRSIWGVAALLILWSFNPGFGGVMYAYMSKVMHFNQHQIAYVTASFAFGAVIGSLLYMKVLAHRFSVKTLTVPIILLGGTAQGIFIFAGNLELMMAFNVFNGMFTAMASVNAHTIAANKCPDHAEGFAYSLLLWAANVSYFTSGLVGGFLYDKVLEHHINPLYLASAAFTFVCLAVVKSLDLERSSTEDKPA